MRYLWLFLGFLSLFNTDMLETQNNDHIDINGEYTIENTRITYGSIYRDTQDGLMILSDVDSGVEIQRIYYDNGGQESFKYVADVGNSEFVVVCERYPKVETYELPSFRDILLIKYDMNGKKMKYFPLVDNVASFHNHNEYLIVQDKTGDSIFIDNNLTVHETLTVDSLYTESYLGQYQGTAYVNGEITNKLEIDEPGIYEVNICDGDYQFTYFVTIEPVIIIDGKMFQDMYIGEVAVFSKGDIYLNNEIYHSGSYISKPGFYQLKIKGSGGYEYFDDFTILPSLTYFDGKQTVDFTNHLEVFQPIAIYSNAISLVLNGQVYNSDMIVEPGPYQLSVYGVNGMTYDVFFDIYPTVFGITNEGEYEKVSLSIFGEALLNGEIVTGNVNLEKAGTYHLDLMFGEEVFEQYDFSIKAEVESETVETTFDFNMNYLFMGVIAIGGWIILRKK